MISINNDKPIFEKLDHKNRLKSELVFYKLLAKQKVKANPFNEARSETYSLRETKPGGNPSDTI
jgi:hypothetical protein